MSTKRPLTAFETFQDLLRLSGIEFAVVGASKVRIGDETVELRDSEQGAQWITTRGDFVFTRPADHVHSDNLDKWRKGLFERVGPFWLHRVLRQRADRWTK